MNPLFNILGGMQKISGIQSAISQIRSNPAAVLKNAGYNVPDGMRDPQQIINHLMQSGQLSQDKLSQLQQAATQYR